MIRVIIESPKTGKSYICKSYGKTVTPIHDLLELTITETPLDGRTRYAKQLPVQCRRISGTHLLINQKTI